MNKKRKIAVISIIATASILLVCFIIMLSYFLNYYKAEIDNKLLEDDELINVINDDDYIVFEPKNYDTGLIFYQGAKVDEQAYAPMIRKIAEAGVLCVIAKMPCNFAIFDIDAADDIMDEYEDENIKWYISGHSLGGSMASMYAYDNKDEFEGVILFASYSTKDIKDLDVLSIYGTNDKILNAKKYEESKVNYPSNMTEIIIEGGNHAYFASYGQQKNDGEASISMEEQMNISVEAVLEFVK